MRFTSELTIKAAWRIVASGHEQWEQTGSIEPDHLVKVRKVQIEMAQHLAHFEDDPAILFTAGSTRHQLRPSSVWSRMRGWRKVTAKEGPHPHRPCRP